MGRIASRIVQHRFFDPFIIALIILNGIVLGLETSAHLWARYGEVFVWFNRLVVLAFVVEAMLKIVAVAPRFRLYFGDGWNLFDFIVVVLSLAPHTGQFATIARLARLFRVMRLVSMLPELRLLVATLMRSLPGMVHVMILMSVLMYIYAVLGWHLFHEHDPVHWRTLGLSLLTLFRVVTLEDWTDVMYVAMEVHPYSWFYFVSFVVVGTFVVINLFIAMVVNNLNEAKIERLKELRQVPSLDEILTEIQTTRDALNRLEDKIEAVKGNATMGDGKGEGKSG